MRTGTERITPDIAKSYLTQNLVNRSVKRATVEKYVRALKRGTFKTTPSGIAFDTDGTLVDGQHRLLAIAVSGIPAVMNVSRDVPKDAVEYIDRGTSRSIRDVLSINSRRNPGEESPVPVNQKLISALSQLAACAAPNHKLRVGTDDIIALMDAFRPAAEAVYAELMTKSKIKARAPIFAAAIAAVSCGVDVSAVSKFFQIVFCDDVTGCDEFNINAALNFKSQIEQARAARVHIERKKLYLSAQNAIYHFSNNTGVTRVISPSSARYDVSSMVTHALLLDVDTVSSPVAVA